MQLAVTTPTATPTHPQHNCDPQFFTTVVFYAGSVSLSTRIKFEVFDKHESKVRMWLIVGVVLSCSVSCSQMCPIGQATCTVLDIIKAPDTCCRLEVKFNNAACGYLHIRAWKVRSDSGEGVRSDSGEGCFVVVRSDSGKGVLVVVFPSVGEWSRTVC